jgi:dihydroorotase-like cyclic amidohydrolase
LLPSSPPLNIVEGAVRAAEGGTVMVVDMESRVPTEDLELHVVADVAAESREPREPL